MFNKFFPSVNSLKNKVVFSIASFFKTNEHQELLKKVDNHLLVWNKKLINLKTGDSVDLEDKSPESLAQAAYHLLSKNKKILHIALYLEPSEFVATEYHLTNVAARDIVSALQYQVDNLLPAYPRLLLLAANHNASHDSNIALWFDKPRSEQLYNAFNEQALELITIIPRTLLATINNSLSGQKHLHINEYDQQGLFTIALEQQSLIQWSQISSQEMKDEEYYQQWLSDLIDIDKNKIIAIENDSFFQQLNLSRITELCYTFFPDIVKQNLKQHSRLKMGRLAMFSSLIFIVLLSTPFIKNTLLYYSYNKEYLDYKEKTTGVQIIRSEVNQFEQQWALFLEYPKLDHSAIISQLNNIIPKNSWLTLFEIKDNKVEIEGNSPDAAGMLQVISQQDEFEGVAFNQRIRLQGNTNEHFGISFYLKNNTDVYREKFLTEPH